MHLFLVILFALCPVNGARSACNSWFGSSLERVEGPPDFGAWAGRHKSEAPIFITFSTLPSRLPLIHPVLLRLVRQTTPADAVFLALPTFSAVESRCYRVPRILRVDPELKDKVTILRAEKDYGPATKLIPLIKLLKASHLDELQDALILVLDDDQLYPLNMVEMYLRWAPSRTGSALTLRGHKLPKKRPLDWYEVSFENIAHSYELAKLTCVDIMTAVGSYLVRPRFFTSALWEGLAKPPRGSIISQAAWDAVRFADDVWVSGQLARNGIPREVIPGRSEPWTPSSPPADYVGKMTIHPWMNAELKTARGSSALGGGPVEGNLLLLSEFAADWSCPGTLHTLPSCLQGPHKQDIPRLEGVPCVALNGTVVHRSSPSG